MILTINGCWASSLKRYAAWWLTGTPTTFTITPCLYSSGLSQYMSCSSPSLAVSKREIASEASTGVRWRMGAALTWLVARWRVEEDAAVCAEPYSVALEWPAWPAVIHSVRLRSSMQYQILPPAVTSYCHCSISVPFTTRRARSSLRGCCRLPRFRGSAVMDSHATRALPGAAALICAQPLTASDVAYRKSQPPGTGGGATRSLRLANALSHLVQRRCRRQPPGAR